MTIISPIDGMVLRREIEPGEFVKQGDTAFWVGQPKPLRITAEVDEEDIPLVKLKQRALIKSDAFPEQVSEGLISDITPKGDPLNKNFRVRISLPENSPLYVGMTVEVNIIINEVDNIYVEKLLSGLDDNKGAEKYKIAWDPGNGATGNIVKKLCNKLPGKHLLINEKIDGTFPAHHPDPTVEKNLQQLIKLVKDNDCNFGVAFDGDGDRIGVVDSKGRVIWGDQLLAFYARKLLKENPGATIIADIKASNVLFNEIRKYGGKAIGWKSGHSLIKAKMAETKAMLAGEMTGHVFFADKYYGFDDGIYAAVRLIDLVNGTDISLDQMLDELPKTFNTPEIRISCSEDKKFAVIEKIKDELRKSNTNFIDIDGVRLK